MELGLLAYVVPILIMDFLLIGKTSNREASDGMLLAPPHFGTK